MFQPTIIVQGKAGAIRTSNKEAALYEVKVTARQGYDLLTSGGSATDAVVAPVSAMEDDFNFNAGRRSRLTLKGEVEVDAIVDDRNLASGAVCALRGCANPVQLARLVMDKTEHCLLASDGARDFMESQGIAAVADSELVTERAQATLQQRLS